MCLFSSLSLGLSLSNRFSHLLPFTLRVAQSRKPKLQRQTERLLLLSVSA